MYDQKYNVHTGGASQKNMSTNFSMSQQANKPNEKDSTNQSKLLTAKRVGIIIAK